MAADFLQLGNNQQGNALRSDVQNFARMYYAIQNWDGKSKHMINGSDFTQLESLFGLTAGQGTTLSFLLDQTTGILTSDASQSTVMSKLLAFINQIG